MLRLTRFFLVKQCLGVLILGLGGIFLAHAESQTKLTTTTATRQILPVLRYLDARIEAVHQATVSAQVRGRIIEMPYDVDDYVKKGDVIVRFRDREPRAAYKVARAHSNEARLEFNRIKAIYAKKLVAKAVLDKAEAGFKSAHARLEQAQEALEHTVVRAPYSGIVVKRYVEVGELARVGQKIMTGLSLEKLRITAEIPQSMVYAVREYQQAQVWLGKDLNQVINVNKLTISPFANKDSHTFSLRANLPEGDYKVYPGMYVKVGFVVGKMQALVIPLAAVVQRSEVTAVYVQADNGLLSMRQIRLGRAPDAENISVLAGLHAGEKVVLNPVHATALIKQQMPVKAK